ncbi:Eml6, partial [Symbiodinium microadriaticum]
MRSGEVFEITLGTNSSMLLLESHSHRELHGLCINPVDSDEYATVGDDGVVRVWSIALRRCIRRVSLEVAGRTLSWSPDGSQIAVGIGGDPAMNTKDGAIIILSSQSLDVVHEDRKAKFTISDLKYSQSGSLLAVASRDGKIYLHDCQSDSSLQQYKLLNVINMPSKECFATHLDFSANSTILRVSSSTCDLLHFDLGSYPHSEDVQVIPLAATVRDEKWSTNNVPYGWMVK